MRRQCPQRKVSLASRVERRAAPPRARWSLYVRPTRALYARRTAVADRAFATLGSKVRRSGGMADATVSKTVDLKGSCGFDSHLRHQD